MFDLLVKMTPGEERFLASVRAAMERFFGADRRRVEHALQVSLYARELLAYIEADQVLTLTVAYLHDIGIHAAERRHGSNAGKWQEVEGPPIARAILAELGAEQAFIDKVADIVAKHHTPRGIDAPEFRILWDADALVNFAGALSSKSAAQIEAILQGHMATEPGFRMARRIFLQDAESHRKWPTDL